MELRQGVQHVSSARLEGVLAAARRPDTCVYALPEVGVRDRDSFFAAVRQRFPLDPPVVSSYSWEALQDSLWSGLDELECARVVIVWPQSRVLAAAAPRDFASVLDMWKSLAEQLHDADATVGRPKEVCVVVM